MVDRVNVLHSRTQAFPLGELPLHNLDTRNLDAGPHRIIRHHESAHLMVPPQKLGDETAAYASGSPGYKDLHCSRSSVD